MKKNMCYYLRKTMLYIKKKGLLRLFYYNFYFIFEYLASK